MLSLHSGSLTKGLGGKIKGQGAGTLARLSSLPLALFSRMEKEVLNQPRIVLLQALSERSSRIKTLFQTAELMRECARAVCSTLCIQTDDGGENPWMRQMSL